MRAKDLLESSFAPFDPSSKQRQPHFRTATKTKEEKLGFLQDNFSFKPRINPAVPDFEGLYWAFQKEAIRQQEVKEATRNKPFKLRTSNLHCRQRQANEKITKVRSNVRLQHYTPFTLPHMLGFRYLWAYIYNTIYTHFFY